jgi:lysophospholipase L1-like esterase
MTPRDFCSWFEGVLDMAETSDGAHFTTDQVVKIRERLADALKEKEKPSGLGGRPPGARC